ncbi:hypothetical protein [Lentzea sp. NPDC003310]|uniref:hypothetical protein n=1 Tax=Lentzea sp. NPDC003310 TaxID=3154447 RepID=UPI0033ACEA39
MAEKPDETGTSAEPPWPVVGRGMINYDPESTGGIPTAAYQPGAHVEATAAGRTGVRWLRIVLVFGVLVVVTALVVYALVSP